MRKPPDTGKVVSRPTEARAGPLGPQDEGARLSHPPWPRTPLSRRGGKRGPALGRRGGVPGSARRRCHLDTPTREDAGLPPTLGDPKSLLYAFSTPAAPPLQPVQPPPPAWESSSSGAGHVLPSQALSRLCSPSQRLALLCNQSETLPAAARGQESLGESAAVSPKCPPPLHSLPPRHRQSPTGQTDTGQAVARHCPLARKTSALLHRGGQAKGGSATGLPTGWPFPVTGSNDISSCPPWPLGGGGGTVSPQGT